MTYTRKDQCSNVVTNTQPFFSCMELPYLIIASNDVSFAQPNEIPESISLQNQE